MYTSQPTLCSKLQNSELQGYELQNSELQNSAIGSLACTQVIMSDIGVEEEVIVIDIENDIVDDSNINAAPSASTGGDPLNGNGNDDAAVGRRKRGGQGSDLWSLYTDDVNLHQNKSTVCKHCRMLVNHHKKSESVKVHLNNCVMFRKLMNSMEEDKRPD
jgi:xanthine dehydrogenase molybdopterin-binding subunit B